jgi:chromate transporter
MQKSPFTRRPSFREALRFWFKLGWISFGGTAGHIAIMHDYLVDKRKWISNSRFFHALSLCMLLPGPEAQQLAIYIGWKLHGKKGGIAAGTLFVLPSMLILLVLSIIYVKFGALPVIAAMFNGLKPAVVALIIVAVVKVAHKAITGPLQIAMAAVAFAVIFFFNISLPAVIGATIIIALVIRAMKPSLLSKNAEPSGEKEAEKEMDHLTDTQKQAFSVAGLLRQIAVFLLFWTAPLIILYAFAAAFPFWKALVLFWTQAALFTIGGSYTVLPYVAQFAVGRLHWLSKLQMIDGFALAETTPGPLIIVVSYVGFLAGYHQFNQSIPLATLALLLTTYYTFLPCFFYIFAGGPLIEKTHGNATLQNILNLVTASIVGMIVNLTLYLGKDVVFPSGADYPAGVVYPAGAVFHHPDLYAVAWILISLLLILKFRVKVVYLIAASVLYGLIRYYFWPAK